MYGMRALIAYLIVLAISAGPAAAVQEGQSEQPAESASGLAYENALRFRGIDTDVRYLDPASPLPELETGLEFAPVEESVNGRSQSALRGNWVQGLVAAAVILFLAFLIVQSGIASSLSFRKDAKNARRDAKNKAAETALADRKPADLDAILRQTDRQKALVGLSQFVLERCLKANGVLLQRSWTEREAFRKLPKSLPNLSDIRALVFDSERVGFGGRTISDEEFQAHVSRMRPLLQGLAP